MNTHVLRTAAALLRSAEFSDVPDAAPSVAALIRSRHAIAVWLDTEAASNAGDEIHDECTAQTCTLMSAIDAAENIMKVLENPQLSDRLPITEPQVSAEPSVYEVSIFPKGDVNKKTFTLLVEKKYKHEMSAECWIVHDGHTGYGADAQPVGHVLDAPLLTREAALDVAYRAAPCIFVNGSTATEVYRRYTSGP